MFGELNDDRRPNPAFPSLSVGGVVSYRTGAGEEGRWPWRRWDGVQVPPPPAPTDEEREVYSQKSEAWYLPWPPRVEIVRDAYPPGDAGLQPRGDDDRSDERSP